MSALDERLCFYPTRIVVTLAVSPLHERNVPEPFRGEVGHNCSGALQKCVCHNRGTQPNVCNVLRTPQSHHTRYYSLHRIRLCGETFPDGELLRTLVVGNEIGKSSANVNAEQILRHFKTGGKKQR